MSGPPTDDDDAIPEGTRDRFGGPAMTVEQVAQLYGVPAAILRRAIERGELPLAATADGQEALSRAAVLTWLKRRRAGWA
jgi:excisionase family DNA binding protein